MGSPIEVQLILCDAAQADPSGKVHMLGAGWSMTKSPTSHAVVVLLKVPWDRTNEVHELELILLDADGHPATLRGPNGTATEVRAGGRVEVGRPPGVAPGSRLSASFALNVAPMVLAPGRYEWRLEIDGSSHAAPFTVLG